MDVCFGTTVTHFLQTAAMPSIGVAGFTYERWFGTTVTQLLHKTVMPSIGVTVFRYEHWFRTALIHLRDKDFLKEAALDLRFASAKRRTARGPTGWRTRAKNNYPGEVTHHFGCHIITFGSIGKH
jgi:hypothetical protein